MLRNLAFQSMPTSNHDIITLVVRASLKWHSASGTRKGNCDEI
jgi:hypothetical protein